MTGGLTAAVGLTGVAVGLFGVVRGLGPVRIGWLVPLIGIRLQVDQLSGLFLAITGAVAFAVGLYAVAYARAERLPRFALWILPLFVAAMLLVASAGSVSTFLLAWELMAGASLVLVCTEHHRPAARSAGVFYAVLTQLGFVAILLALSILAAATGTDSFAELAHRAATLPPATRAVVFVLTVAGFGSKAGLLPLHAWLPRAHPEAPSPASALMSAAMVNLGIYGLVRFDLQVLGPGPRWWGLTLLVLGALSAVYGVLHAAVATDLKRLLAYSTTENMGLITLGLGAALLTRSVPGVAAIALTASLLHLIGHAAFKTLGFLAAGSVLVATGLRDIDRLGGLARRMPATTVAFGLAALGASGLPLGAGFVSEWLLLQALIHAPHEGHTLLALVMPPAVGAVALTTGLGVAAMVKAFGVGFLARPRSDAAAEAVEAPTGMLAGMAVAAAACVVCAVAPAASGPLLRDVLHQLLGAGSAPRLGLLLRLPGAAGSVSATVLAAAMGVAVLLALALALAATGARRRPSAVDAPLWTCGAERLTPRMQYTATSFAQPLQRVFDDVLRPDTDVRIDHHAESRYLLSRVAYSGRLTDAIEDRLYWPVVRLVRTVARGLRRAHSGSVHLYLAYGAIGLLLVLVLAR